MLRCFDHFRQQKNGIVLWQNHVKAAEKAAKKTEQEAGKAEGHVDKTAEEYEKLKTETSKAQARLESAKERADTSIGRLKGKVDSIRPEGGSEQDLEQQKEPTIEEFSRSYSSQEFWQAMRSMPPAESKRFQEELGQVITALDEFNKLLTTTPKTGSEDESKELKKALDRFRSKRREFNATHDAKYAIPDIVEETRLDGDDTKIKEDTKNVLASLKAVHKGNDALNPEGMSTVEGEKKLQEDIASLKSMEEKFLREFELLKTMSGAYVTNHEVQKVGPALQELALTLKVKVAAVIGDANNKKDAHPELFTHWKAQVAKWENAANSGTPGDPSSKWSQKAAEAYRDAIHTGYLGGKYELKRSTPGGAFTALEDKGQVKPDNAPKIDDIKTFLRSEGVLNDGNQAAFNANLKAMPFYTTRFTKPEQRTVAEQRVINQRLEAAKLPTALRPQTQYALDHPGGVILGNPLLFLTLLSLIIFDGKNRTKYLVGLGALLGIEAIGGFGALGDAAKSGYESWLKPLFEGTGEWGKKFMEWIFGKKAVENVEQGKFAAFAEWMNLRKAKDFADKSAKGVWEALKNDRDKLMQAGDQAGKTLGGKLKDLSETEVGKFVGLPWVTAWLNGDPPDKTFAEVVAEQDKKRAAAAAAESAKTAQNQTGIQSPEKSKDSPSEMQGKLDNLKFEPETNLKWAAPAVPESGEAVRMLKVKGSDTKDHDFEVRYDGTRYRIREVQVHTDGTKPAALEFDMGFKLDAVKQGFPKVLAQFEIGAAHGWKSDRTFVRTFLESTKSETNIPKGTKRLVDHPPYYDGNGRFSVIVQRGSDDVFVEISIDEKTQDNTGNAYLLTQVIKDGGGNFVPTTNKKDVKRMNEQDAENFVKGLGTVEAAKPVPPETSDAGKYFESVALGAGYERLGQPWENDESGKKGLNILFRHNNKDYKAYHSPTGHEGDFLVEEVSTTPNADGTFEVGEGSKYRLMFTDAKMFTENFPATVTIANGEGGNTLALLLNNLNGLPYKQATLLLNGDTTGEPGKDKYYDLLVETEKGTYKLSALVGEKDGFQVYNDKDVGLGKFTNGTEAAKAMGLEATTSNAPANQPAEKPQTVNEEVLEKQKKEGVLALFKIPATEYDAQRKAGFDFEPGQGKVNISFNGSTIEVNPDWKIGIEGIGMADAAFGDYETPFTVLQTMNAYKTGKAVSRITNQAFYMDGKYLYVNKGRLSKEEIILTTESNEFKSGIAKLLNGWFYGGKDAALNTVGRYKEIAPFYANPDNQRVLKKMVKDIDAQYGAKAAYDDNAAFYMEGDTIMFADTGLFSDATLESLLGKQIPQIMDKFVFGSISQEQQAQVLTLALNKAWHERKN